MDQGGATVPLPSDRSTPAPERPAATAARWRPDRLWPPDRASGARYLAIGAGLSWPLTGPAAWAAVAGGLPAPVPFLIVSVCIWSAAWCALGLAHTADVRPRWQALEGLGPAALVAAWSIVAGLAVAAAWVALWAVAGAPAAGGVWTLRLALQVVALAAAVAAIAWAVAWIGAAAGAAPPGRRATRGAFVRWAAAIAGWVCASWLTKMYVAAFFPAGTARAAAWWALEAVLSAAALWFAAPDSAPGAAAEIGGSGFRPPHGGAAARGRARLGLPLAGLMLLAAIGGFALARPALVVAFAGAPLTRSALGRASVAGGPAAEAAARAAAASALGQVGVALAEGADAQDAVVAAAAAESLDPAAPAAYEGSAIAQLTTGDVADGLASIAALDAVGSPAPAYALTSQACAAVAAGRMNGGISPAHARSCAATSAAAAMWLDPWLVWWAPVVPVPARGLATALGRATGSLGRAVDLWGRADQAQALAGGLMVNASVLADAESLHTVLGNLPPRVRPAAPALGAALLLAGAATSDDTGMGDGTALIVPPAHGRPLPAHLAALIFSAGVVDGAGYGQTLLPLSAPLAQAALAAADAPTASASLLSLAGEFCLAEAAYPQAAAFFSRATAADPVLQGPWANLALVEYEMTHYARAAALARRSIAVADGAEAEIVLGDALYNEVQAGVTQGTAAKQALTQAAAALRDGVRIDPTPFLAWMSLGDVLQAAGQPSQALTAYQTALRWYAFDLANHVPVMAAPGENYAFLQMPGGGTAYSALQARIAAVQGALSNGGS